MTKVNTQIYDNLGEFNAGVEASVSGIRVTQSFANETFEHKRFDGLSEIYRQSKILFYKVMAISSAYNYFLIRLINLFALIFGAYYVIRGELTNGQFVGFILLSNVFVRPIEKVNTMIESYPKGIAGFKRLTEELDKEPTIKDKPGARAVQSLKGDIVYHDVSFSYADATKVLNHINLSIKAGETIAFVGQSGSGKTTLCNLLPRFYEVTEGAITIDGINIQEMTLASFTSADWDCPARCLSFPRNDSRKYCIWQTRCNRRRDSKGSQVSTLGKVIDQMTDGLDTVIGERGVKLSGGQKQRVAIARMFLKNPPILILDEATSALDTETEQVIQESLNSLADGRTTLIIAHRLATIKHATRIIVVSEKGILEEGTHEELMAKRGHYRALHDAQFARDGEPSLS